jgi:glycerophosphoryl diester phosphodiesterase
MIGTTFNVGMTTMCAICLVALTGVACASTEFIAHRGASDTAPENTLAAIRLAWEQGADAVEIDVYLTRDDHIVVMHDANTLRASGKSLVIRESALEELRALDVGAWKGEKWAGERIPTLSEALATIPKGKRMFVEIKCGPEVMPEFEKALKAARVNKRQVAIISFSLDVVKAAKKRSPGFQVYWLSSPVAGKTDELIRAAQEARADGLDLAVTDALDADFVKRVRDAKLKLYVWTVDSPDVARRMIDLGVDGVTSNRAAWLKKMETGK